MFPQVHFMGDVGRSLAYAAMSLSAQSPHPFASFLFRVHVFNMTGHLVKPASFLSTFSKDTNEGDAGPIRPWTEAHSNHHLGNWLGNAFIVLTTIPKVFMSCRLKSRHGML